MTKFSTKIIKENLKKTTISNALSHLCTDAWVTRPERPKAVKQTNRPEVSFIFVMKYSRYKYRYKYKYKN